jgi:hypothetical protein
VVLLLVGALPGADAYAASHICSINITLHYTEPAVSSSTVTVSVAETPTTSTAAIPGATIPGTASVGEIELHPGTFTIAVAGQLCPGFAANLDGEDAAFAGVSPPMSLAAADVTTRGGAYDGHPRSITVVALDLEHFSLHVVGGDDGEGGIDGDGNGGDTASEDLDQLAPLVVFAEVNPSIIRRNGTAIFKFFASDFPPPSHTPSPSPSPPLVYRLMLPTGTGVWRAVSPSARVVGSTTVICSGGDGLCQAEYTASLQDKGELRYMLEATDPAGNTDFFSGVLLVDVTGTLVVTAVGRHPPSIGTLAVHGARFSDRNLQSRLPLDHTHCSLEVLPCV